MKTCPTCKKTFEDDKDTCPDDEAKLVPGEDKVEAGGAAAEGGRDCKR